MPLKASLLTCIFPFPPPHPSTKQAIVSSTAPGLAGSHPLPHEVADAIAEPPNPSTATSSSTGCFMPNVLLVLQGPVSGDAADDESSSPEWLTLSLMEALDACESIPPAVVSCVFPPISSESSSLPELPFDAVLLDTPLVELWRQEARRHFE